MTGWHPSMGPDDTILDWCEDCSKYVVRSTHEHPVGKHGLTASEYLRAKGVIYQWITGISGGDRYEGASPEGAHRSPHPSNPNQTEVKR